jgi:hypothetical protein
MILESVQSNLIGDRCASMAALFFIQYECRMDEAQQFKKYFNVSVITSIVLVIAFIFSQVITYMLKTTVLEKQKFDYSTIVLDDFTVELNISKDNI